MKIQEIYDLAVKMGKAHGPRDKKEVELRLKEKAEEYKKMDKEKKAEFDKEDLTNPFPDTRILYGDPKREVKRVMAGIDIGAGEFLVAKEMERAGKPVDMMISHHPDGVALARLAEVMDVHEDIMTEFGVPLNVIEKLMEKRMAKIFRAVAPINHMRNVDTARLLGLPYACFHTVADNVTHEYLEKFLKKKKMRYLKDVITALKEVPEFKEAAKKGIGPKIFAGSPKSKVGKLAVTGMTGGTEGSEDVYEQLSKAGVGTIVEMHISEDRRKKAEKFHLNVVVPGHICSDNIGFNIIMDELEKKGVEVVPCSGFTRVKRGK